MIGGISFDWVGLDNWTRLFGDGAVWRSWVRSVVFFVLSVGLQMSLGIAIALAIYETRRGRNIITSLVLMPMFMAPVIVGLLGRFLTDSTYGLYAWALDGIGLYNGDILGSPTSAFLAVTLMDVWEWTPLIALIVLAGLTSMPKQVLEAAAIDGASYWSRLRDIVLPMIAGVIIVALLIRSMDAIRYFDIITNTTNGGPADATKIVPIRLYETAFRFFDLGYAAAIGLSMLAVTIVMANLFMRILKQRGLAKMKPARGGVGSRIGLPVVLGVILLWTVVPLVWMVLSSFKPPDELTATTPTLSFTPTLEHYDALFSGGNNIGPYIRNSLIAAGVSTVIAVVLGCLAGYGLARSRFRGKDHVAFWIISQRMAPIAAVDPAAVRDLPLHRAARIHVGPDRGLPDVQPAVRDLDHERLLRRAQSLAGGGGA